MKRLSFFFVVVLFAAPAGFAQTLNTDNTRTNNNRFEGHIPFVDASAFARAVSSAPSTTATCVSPTNTCTFGSVSNFQIGDGVTIRGRGATLTMSTPSTVGFTVTPSLSAGGMGLGGGNYASLTTVASATAGATYNYELISRDKVGGYTTPSSAVTITNGQASLGASTCAVSTATRSGVLNTITFSAPCIGAVRGAAFSFFSSTSSTFDGFYNIETVNSSSQIVVSGPYNSESFGFQPGDSTQNSATGGTATFLLSNHLRWTLGTGVWQYYVCAKRPGDVTYKLIGVTKPNTQYGQDVQFDDYGSPYNDNQLYPAYITNALCNGGAAQNDPSTSTITNIAGTTVTLSDTAINSTRATTALFDDAPGFLAAMNSVSTNISGTVLIPWTANNRSFILNSYFKVPQNISVKQNGILVANETMEFGAQTWNGDLANNGAQAFSYSTTGSALLYVSGVPGIYTSSPGLLLQNLTINILNNTNGGLIELDESGDVIRKNIQYTVETGSNGYLGAAIWYRWTGASADNEFHLEHSLITVSNTSRTTWAPIFYVPVGQNSGGTPTTSQFPRVFVSESDWSIRGFEQTTDGGGGLWEFRNIVRQGGNAPFLWLQSSSGRDGELVVLDHIVQDTDLTGAVAIGNLTGNPALSQVDIFAQDLNNGSSDTGGPAPPFSGLAPREIEQRYNATGRMPNNTGIGTCPSATSSTGSLIRCNYDPILFTGPSAELFFPLAAPTVPTAMAAAGGSLSPLTLEAEITAVGFDGKETVVSPVSSSATTSGTCPGSGNCEISLSWTTVPYAASYNLYGCTTTIGPSCPAMAKQATGIVGTSYNWITLANNGSAPAITTGGQSGHTSTMVWAPTLFAPPITIASLPSASANTGQIRTVNDSTSISAEGQTCAGGSSNTALAFSNGAVWKCF